MFDLIQFNWLTVLLSQTAAIATVGTVWIALYLYRKAKSDILQDAARVLILEVRESEKIVKNFLEEKLNGREYRDSLIKVLPYKGWQKYSHLFVKKMSNDEYDQLNQYFKHCEILEKFIKKNHNFFWITTEERARQKEAIGARLAYDKPGLEGDAFREEVEEICRRYFSTMRYTPQGIKSEIDLVLDSIYLISNTPTWNKLKSIAKYEDLLG